MIPYGHQDVTEEDIKAVEEVLRSDWLTQGPTIEKFERSVTEFCSASNALAVCNATTALHLACRALDLGPGDWLWTTPNTFVASANCALYCGASVDFVDIDPQSYNMSIVALRDKLESAKQSGRLPKIVVPVHFAGQPCQMREIRQLGEKYKFAIIEDAAHAIGSVYLDGVVGNCRFSDITVFSFHPVKIITTGEGGMVVTNNPKLAAKIRLLRSHGITRELPGMVGDSDGAWYYEQVDLGYNYRMTDIQAALGASQMKRIASFVDRRRYLAGRYGTLLAGLPLKLPMQHPDTSSAYHLYVVRVLGGPRERRRIFDGMRSAGVGVNVHYIPVHLQPYYQRLGFRRGDYPNAEHYYGEALSLPLYPGLSDTDQNYIVETLKSLLG